MILSNKRPLSFDQSLFQSKLSKYSTASSTLVSTTDNDNVDDPAQVVQFQLLPLLEIENIHPKDKHIQFTEEGHKYYLRGSSANTISTTTLLGKYFNGFDADLIIRNIMRSSRYFTDPCYQYYRAKASEIKEMWRQPARDGTYNHEQLELYYNGQVADFTRYEHHYLFRKFDRDHVRYLEPYRTEMLLFHEKLRVTGSADILYRNKLSGRFVLGDYKFIKKLKKTGGKTRGKPPLDHLPDCNYIKYALQLSVYRYILETEYGFDVEDQFLLLLHKSQEEYIKEHTPYFKREVEALFEERKKYMQSINLLS